MRSLLYILLFLISIVGKAQQCRVNYTATAENTACGGTVKVALASADTNCISRYWAVLYDNTGAVQARQNFSAAGKAEFTNRSSGTYKVKVEKKDGTDTHPTVLSVTIVSTYKRFSVDMTKATQVAATGECATDGKVALKIKNGSGPFVVAFYKQGSSTPTSVSAPTNKTGNETTVNISGLSPNTKYNIEVTDQIGGGTCAVTEPKNIRDITTLPTTQSFLRGVTLESCKQKGIVRGSRGMLSVEINNTYATGPFEIEVRKKEDNQLIVSASNADHSFAKGAAIGTTQKEIEPDNGKSLEVGKDYIIKIKDVGANCVAERVQKNPLRFSAESIRLHLAHTCSDCGEYEFAVAPKFPNRNSVIPNQVTRDKFYTYNLKVEVKRGGVMLPGFPEQFTNTDALPQTGTNNGIIYGNNEFRFNNLYDAMVHKSAHKVKGGDVITITYEDCALATPIVLTHTVYTTPYKPHTDIRVRKKEGGGDCDREVELTTTFQHGGSLSYTDFCDFTGMKARVKTSNIWQTATSVTNVMYKFYDEHDVNRHRMYVPVSTVTDKYQVEYANASTPLNASAPNDCKHYVSPELTLTKPNLIDNIGIHAYYNGEGILQWEHRGKRVQITNVGGVVTDANPLKVSIRRKDGFQGIKTYTATGPWNLAGTYKIKFPIERTYKAEDTASGYILIMDVPPGEYMVNIKNNCASRDLPLKVEEADTPTYYDIDPLKVETECSKNGQTGKGKLIYRSLSGENTSRLGYLHIFRDPGGTEPIYKRANTGTYMRIVPVAGIPSPSDPTKIEVKAEVPNLPTGNYILGIITASSHYRTAVYKPEENGYTYGYRPEQQKGKGKLADTFIYKTFTVKEITDVVPISVVGMCDPSNASSGMVRVELP
ncbi:hypothetical protein, partial [Capnocytophaga gingivalis]